MKAFPMSTPVTYRFSFGPWNISEGGDPFGGDVRKVGDIAEKLHAYTVPRPRPNSRVKDLPDIALLAEAGALDASNLAQAIAETFAHRATHPVPARLPDLPEAWAPVYARMAEEEDLPWADLTRLGDAVRAFLDPVLAGAGGVWEPAAWRWMDDEP